MEDVKKLIIWEMAQNHGGSLQEGFDIIHEFSKFILNNHPYKEEFSNFEFAIKFQFRDIDSFIHPAYKNRQDIKYVKRFQETKLTKQEFQMLKARAVELGFKTICTPFDEKSVEFVDEMKFDYLKIASCSFTDWPLLNKIAEYNLPIIASTAGASVEDVDKVVSFFKNRNKDLSILSCTGEYPTEESHMELNQIKFLKDRYGLRTGLSSHEGSCSTDNSNSSHCAVALGATIFERHVYHTARPNLYSINFEDAVGWLRDIRQAEILLGQSDKKRVLSSKKEQKDLRTFKRGVYLKRDVEAGEKITRDDVYYAFPNVEDQLVANDMSKYASIITKNKISKDAALMESDVIHNNDRNYVLKAVKEIKNLISFSNIVVPKDCVLELSHHYGMKEFVNLGLASLTLINEDYCKKYLISLPNQRHPEQYHKTKKETFLILYGDVEVYIDRKRHFLQVGDMLTINPEERHEFESGEDGCIIEELSTTHVKEDSFYTNESVQNNKYRKTTVGFWRNV